MWWLCAVYISTCIALLTTTLQDRPKSKPAHAKKNRSGYQNETVASCVSKSLNETRRRNRSFPQKVDLLIIGGSEAGLALGESISRERRVSFVICEKNRCPGDIWRQRYDRFHLEDIAELCSLPFSEIPEGFPRFLSRFQFADYLDTYLMNPETKLRDHYFSQLQVLRYFETAYGYFLVEIKDLVSDKILYVSATQIALCTRLHSNRKIPEIPGLDRVISSGNCIHASEYKNPSVWKGKRVCVLGYDNSASKIALDLWEHDIKVSMLCSRDVVCVHRDDIEFVQSVGIHHPWLRLFEPIPFLVSNLYLMLCSLARWKHLNIDLGGIQFFLGPRIRKLMGISPVVDVGTMNLIQNHEIQIIRKEIKEFDDGNRLVLCDGSVVKFDKLVLCTSQAPDIEACHGIHHVNGNISLINRISDAVTNDIIKSLDLPSPQDNVRASFWFAYKVLARFFARVCFFMATFSFSSNLLVSVLMLSISLVCTSCETQFSAKQVYFP